MKILLACLLLVATSCFGQESAPVPSGPFRFNLRVVYAGAKEHPDREAFIYKTLRELPGIGIVDESPDAVLLIGENSHGNQYACAFTVMTPANWQVAAVVDRAASAYAVEQPAQKVGDLKPRWQAGLEDGVRKLQPMYHFEGGWMAMNESPKIALQLAVKKVDLEYVEKQRRHYDYLLAHPYVPSKWDDSPVTKL